MNITTEALRELHRLHRQLADLHDRLERGPKQVQAADASVCHMEEELQQAKDAAKKLRIHADSKQLQLKERETRVKDLQSKLNTCSSNREYQMLKEQIAADEQANSVLADEILEALERMDELADKAKIAESHLEKARREAERVKQRVANEQGTIHADLARLQDELARAEAALPGDFKEEYRRIIKARGEQALAPVDGDCCGGCYHVLSLQVLNELYLSKPVFCRNCGALLYFSEDRVLQKHTPP